MSTSLNSAQLYDVNNEKTTPLLASFTGTTSNYTSLLNILHKYKVYAAASGGFFGLFVYLGAAVLIVERFVKDEHHVIVIRDIHLQMLLFGMVSTTAVLIASAMVLSVLRTLTAMSSQELPTATAAILSAHGWQSNVLIILVYCFILGFECGAGMVTSGSSG